MIIEIVDNFYHSKSSHRCQVHIQYCNHIYTIQKYWYRSVNIYYFVRCTHHDLYSVIYADINLMQCILNNNQCRQSNTPHPLHTGHHFLPYSPLNHTGFTAQCLINNWYGLTFDLLYHTHPMHLAEFKCRTESPIATAQSFTPPQASLEEDICTLNSLGTLIFISN